MRKYIPTLQELQAFEAVARHLSFTRAGTDLHVTQSAVSHHIAKLEGLLKLKLFERTTPRLTLTTAGQIYLERIEPLLNQIESATIELLAHGDQGGTINLACPTTFGVNWLIPRLPSFNQVHRNVTLSLVRYSFSQGGWPAGVDAAIRFGDGNWPGLVSHYLMGREMVVICHPDLLKGRDRLRKPSDLQGLMLLQHEGEPNAWRNWFAAAGATHPAMDSGPRFDPFSMLIKAASAKLGVALVPRCLLDPELDSGEVAIAFDTEYQSDSGYYLTYPEKRRGARPIEALQHWLEESAT